MRRITLLLGMVLVVPASGLQAQDGTARHISDGLEVGQVLRVTAPGLWLEDVAVERLTPDSLWVGDGGVVIPVAYDEMESVSLRVGRRNAGAVLGGTSGLLAGGLIVGMAASFGCQDPSVCTSSERRGAAWGAAVGLVVGALVGGWIGSLANSWRPIFP